MIQFLVFQSDEPDTYCAFIKFYMRSFVYILFYFILRFGFFSGETAIAVYLLCLQQYETACGAEEFPFVHFEFTYIYIYILVHFSYDLSCVEFFSAVRISSANIHSLTHTYEPSNNIINISSNSRLKQTTDKTGTIHVTVKKHIHSSNASALLFSLFFFNLRKFMYSAFLCVNFHKITGILSSWRLQ